MKLGILPAAFDGVVRFTRKLTLGVIVLLGLTILIGSVGFALYTPTKLIAVLVTAIGCSFGTGVLALILPKLSIVRLDEDSKRISTEEQLRTQLEEKLERVTALEKDRASLQSDIERQKSMRVDVNAYRTILRLGLIQLDMDATDFKRTELEYIDRSHRLDPRRSHIREYVGVLKYKFQANLGVDLTKLRFHDRAPDIIEISGLKPEYQGMQNDEKDWALREIRIHKLHEPGDLRREAYEVITGSPAFVSHSEDQEKEFKKRINNGIAFKSMDAHIVKMASEVLRLVLAPLGRNIVFETEPNLEGRGFMEYLEFHNLALDKQIRVLEEKKDKLLFPYHSPSSTAASASVSS